jgi:RNA polymerase sigma-B factor
MQVRKERAGTAARGKAEGTRLFEEYRRTRDPHVREQLIRRNAPLARSLAARFLGRGEPIEDLEQVAMLALVEAVDAFEPERGHRFSSYAVPTIVGSLRLYLRDKGWHLKVPRRIREQRVRVVRAAEALSQELGRTPTTVELAAEIGATEEETLLAMEAGNAYEILSLDSPRPASGLPAGQDGESEPAPGSERIGGLDPALEAVEERLALHAALASLDPLGREVLNLHFFQNLSQERVARRLGVSQMQVSRLQRQALDRLRRQLTAVSSTPLPLLSGLARDSVAAAEGAPGLAG